jgi:hypothetical protein
VSDAVFEVIYVGADIFELRTIDGAVRFDDVLARRRLFGEAGLLPRYPVVI